MKDCYLFIIWNKALFCKDRILKDLSNTFIVEKYFYVNWDKKLFKKNLQAFYGTKSPDIDDKIKAIGNDKFLVIIAKDPNPIFDLRETYNGQEQVNANAYDKKKLYRKWTAGNFRVHSTINENETKHDLTILFGNDYEKIISSISNDEIFNTNTRGISDFNTVDELTDFISSFENTLIHINKDSLIILTLIRKDILFLLGVNPSNILTSFNIDNKVYNLIVLGELDGDLPMGILNENEDIANEFIKAIDDYMNYLKYNSISPELNQFISKYNISLQLNKKETMRPQKKKNSYVKLLDSLKYSLAKTRYRR